MWKCFWFEMSQYLLFPSRQHSLQATKQGSLLNCRVLVGLCTSLPCTAMVTFFPLPNGPESFLTLSNTTSLGRNGMWSTSHSAQEKKTKKSWAMPSDLWWFRSKLFVAMSACTPSDFRLSFQLGMAWLLWCEKQGARLLIPSQFQFTTDSQNWETHFRVIIMSSIFVPYVFHMCSIFFPCHHHFFICVPYFPFENSHIFDPFFGSWSKRLRRQFQVLADKASGSSMRSINDD